MNNSVDKIEIPYLEMGVGFLFGLSVGYALKKVFKTVLLVSGLGFMFMILLNSQGAISIGDMQLHDFIENGMEQFKSIFELLKNKLEKYHVAGGVSALAGFAIGIKIA